MINKNEEPAHGLSQQIFISTVSPMQLSIPGAGVMQVRDRSSVPLLQLFEQEVQEVQTDITPFSAEHENNVFLCRKFYNLETN